MNKEVFNQIVEQVKNETREVLSAYLKDKTILEGIEEYPYKYETLLKVKLKNEKFNFSGITIYIDKEKDSIQVEFLHDIIKDYYTNLESYKDDLKVHVEQAIIKYKEEKSLI